MSDELDFATFVGTHSTALLRAAFLLTGERGAAEDLVQETFTRLYPSWHRVTAADVPLAYVRRSLTNTFLNGKRKRSSTELLFADPPERGYEPDLAGPLSDRELVRELLEELSPKARAVMVLRFYEDLSDADIAADLGCRQGTVRSIVSRGLDTLRVATERRAAAASTNGTQR